MTAYVRIFKLCALLTLVVGCAGAQPKPDWATAPDADIPALSTFGWADAESSAPRAILDARVRHALREELLGKGYEEAQDTPDFLISYESVAHDVTKRSSPIRIGIGMGSWGSNVGGSVGTSVGVGGREDAQLQSRLTIRALDPDSDRELWIGISTSFGELPEQRVIERAVAGVMRGFPGKRN